MADQVGKWIPAGLAEGIADNMQAVKQAANQMSNNVLSNVNIQLPETQKSTVLEKQPLIFQIVTPDQRVFAEWLVDDITQIQNFKINRQKLF